MFRLLGFCILLSPCLLRAQEPVSIALNNAGNALPSTTYFVLSDSHDQIWIATASGVFRYDGYTFQHLTSADGLGDNEILRIYEDKKGRIWFQSVNGNPSFYLNGKIYNASNSDMLQQLKFNKMILTECEDAAGNLYIGSREYMYYQITPDDRVIKRNFYGEENFMWSSSTGIHYVEREFHNGYQAVRGCTYKDIVLISVRNEVMQITDDTVYHSILLLPDVCREIIFLRMFNDNEVYIGTRNGLYIWNKTTQAPPRLILEGLSVSSVTPDFEQNFWVTTLEGGVFFIPSMDVNMYNIGHGLPQSKITCIERDESNNLWIGMAQDNYAVLHPNGYLETHRMDEQSTLNITNIRHYYGSTWVISKSSILQIRGKEKRSLNIYGNDLLVQSNGNFLLAQDNTIKLSKELFEKHLEEIIYNLRFRRSDFDLVNARTNVIKEDDVKRVWLGTSRGLYQYTDTAQTYGTINPVFYSPVRDIAFSKNSTRIYVATMNGLLVLHDNKLDTILNESNAMPNSECNALYTDENDDLWAAFGNALVRIHFNGNSFTCENVSRLRKIACSSITDIDMIGSVMYLATEYGLIYFDAEKPYPQQVAPLLHFTGFTINDVQQEEKSKYAFSYFQNDISISFTALSYFSGSNNTYKYLLEGYDTDWQLTPERGIHYKSLSPGSYTFHIRAVNSAGIESEEKTILFNIAPPFWNMLWFRLSVLLLVSLLVAYLWRRRMHILRIQFEAENKTIRLQKDKVEMEKKLIDLEQQAFRQQMNPHFIFNALNTIKGYYAENDIPKANEYISKFSKLLRSILENSQQVVSLATEINSVQLYLELAGMRYAHKFTYAIHVDGSVDSEETGIPPMLLQPFIENAIIHGISPMTGQGHIDISFSHAEDMLQCIIEDNGIGRAAAAQRVRSITHRSRATEIITEYLEALNNDNKKNTFRIDIEDMHTDSGEAKGTKVVIRIPWMKYW
ncbi:MAG: histidine kinase [Chitinophagales bacterium]